MKHRQPKREDWRMKPAKQRIFPICTTYTSMDSNNEFKTINIDSMLQLVNENIANYPSREIFSILHRLHFATTEKLAENMYRHTVTVL